MHDFVKLCLATGICLLFAAAISGWANQYLGDWFQAAGLAIVGLFHLILAAFNWPPSSLRQEDSGEGPTCDAELRRED